jgi:hypothetical protein
MTFLLKPQAPTEPEGERPGVIVDFVEILKAPK